MILLVAVPYPQSGTAKPDKPDPAVVPELPERTKGAPVMPTILNAFRHQYEDHFCSENYKERELIVAQKVLNPLNDNADKARKYFQEMREYINEERKAGRLRDAAQDEKVIEYFEKYRQYKITIDEPRIQEEIVKQIENIPVVFCGERRKETPIELPTYDQLYPSTPARNDAAKPAPPQRTPTLSGLHHPAKATIKKPLPSASYKGYRPPLIAPPTNHGAIPKPPAPKIQDTQDIKVPGGN